MAGNGSSPPVTPELLLNAYASGYFPMAMSRRGRTLYWFNPDVRAVLPLQDESFHLSRSLRKLLRTHPYVVTVDRAFPEVIRACADTPRRKEDGTWINKEIIALYTALHELGFAHSVEVWERRHEDTQAPLGLTPDDRRRALALADEDARWNKREPSAAPHVSVSKTTLVGGLYGISLGGAFFGESMFSHRTGASKIALAHLVERLKAAGYHFLDAQFENPHLVQFGFQSIPKAEYHTLLCKAMSDSSNPSTRFLTTSV